MKQKIQKMYEGGPEKRGKRRACGTDTAGSRKKNAKRQTGEIHGKWGGPKSAH